MSHGKARQGAGICQYLSALAALALLAAVFARSPFYEPIVSQLFALNYVRGGQLREMIDASPAVVTDTLRTDSSPSLATESRVDIAGGFYDRPVIVSVRQSESAPVYYTLDGSLPTERSRRYRGPILIDRSAVLTLASLSSESPGAAVETHTYLIDERVEAPVLSLAIHPAFLWNRHSGLFLNSDKRGSAWRRPARVEYFASRSSPPVRIPAEVSIHGNWSRSAPKKSFQVSYASAWVSGGDSAGLFGRTGEDSARAVVARAAAMDVSYRLGDELFRALFADAGGLIARSTPVQLLLNGTPWGLYNLHEKIDKIFLKRSFGAGDYDFVADPRYGKTANDGAWNRLLDLFIGHDLSEETNFVKATGLIDIENFTDYWLFNIYAANLDWPHTNYFAFRKRAPGERWRWISWDTDATFNADRGLTHDSLSWATRSELRHDLSYNGRDVDQERWLVSTAIIRSLLRNRNYQARFVRRFCELRDSYFQPDRLRARFRMLVERLTPHFAVDWERWPGSQQAYQAGVQGVHRFIGERPAIVLEQFQKRFGIAACPAT
jgi:hypothetical protein